MSEFEKKVINKLADYKYYIFTAILLLIGLYARHMNLYYVYGDCEWIMMWFDEIAEKGGLLALKENIGDYTVPFQFVLALLSYIPVNRVVVYKYFVTLFDILLSFEISKIVYLLTKSEFKRFLSFSLVFLFPLFIVNSAVWGQCDSIYAFFVILSMRKVLEKKYLWAFVFFGIGFSFKLQAIFFLPFLVISYFSERKFPFTYFLVAFAAFYAANIPAFLFGRSLLEPITNYFRQTGEFERLYLNIFNLWYMFEGGFVEFFYIAIAATLLVLGGALLFLFNKKELDLSEHYLELAVWCTWTCTMFLPAMHDRYTFLAELFLLILCIVKNKFYSVALIQFLCSFQAYVYFLYQQEYKTQILGILVLFAYGYFSLKTFEQINSGKNGKILNI